jgi:plasmid stabilization system protein ParE
MDRRVIWTETAWSDLEQIAQYISKDSAQYAAAFAREVRDASRSLSRFAGRGRIVPELEQPGLREISVRNYRMIYSISAESVHILGLIHGAPAGLSPEADHGWVQVTGKTSLAAIGEGPVRATRRPGMRVVKVVDPHAV